ncbi:transglycosylase SLT domain-containing protein [Francisella sp. LA112445]|uniref:transglycosylase SLT domain-containing protein n=1 Tax=Francisella sp. LA112445 TaxID=1395624 RepID=UPI001788B982|nr:transglycosylase SLT domain-containing protein [Francisella sp. LA112445]QIW10091.1 hypothetical protein FIP56_05080 [Francisella sp. LA112445]
MKKLFLITLILFVLNPTNIFAKTDYPSNTNICQILKYHPSWKKSLIKANNKYNISPAFTLAIIHQESKFHANVKNSHSSAFGYAQALNGTWKVFQRDVEPNAKRNNFNDSVEFVDWYMARLAHKLDIKASDSFDLYLAYMLGEGGYRNYMDNPHKSSSMLHREAIAAKVRLKSQVYNLELEDCKI